jgi:hypothetical protein
MFVCDINQDKTDLKKSGFGKLKQVKKCSTAFRTTIYLQLPLNSVMQAEIHQGKP